MKYLFVLAIAFLTCNSLFSQNFSSTDPSYIKNVKLGEMALNAEKFDSCLIYYTQAFAIKQTSVLSTLRMAACAFSNDNQKEYQKQLKTAFDLNWGDTRNLFGGYPEFQYLQGSRFADDIESKYAQYAKDSGMDIDLMKEFDAILESDQAQRQEMRGVSEKHGWQSPQMDSLWKIQNYSDSVNTIRISQLIDQMGYPGKSTVGPGHQSTAFLVIQHADQKTQEKYLPIIKKAADEGEVRWASVALLIDRVRQGQGKKQIYGSQVNRDSETNEYFFGPIEEPYKVDSLRASVGLGLLSDYAANWDFTYDPTKHVARHNKEKGSMGPKLIGPKADTEIILHNIAQFSKHVMNGDEKAIAAAYTVDGKIFPTNANIIEGESSLEKYWKPAEGYVTTYHKITPVEINVQGDQAYDFGHYEGESKSPDGSLSKWNGKYVIVWKKVDGEWKMYLDIWNNIK